VNLRQLVGINEPYFKFNREERHYAAILFHILNHADNAERALRSVQSDWKPKDGEFGIYLEYSYARDIWHGLDFTHGDKVRISDSEAVNAVNRRKIDSILKILGQLQFDPTIVPQTSGETLMLSSSARAERQRSTSSHPQIGICPRSSRALHMPTTEGATG
jgi:hypothetical protein